jgi:hypothetical protein
MAASGQHTSDTDVMCNENLSADQQATKLSDHNMLSSQLLRPAETLPKIESGSAPFVLAQEPKPNFVVRLCSYLKTYVPCLGPHSQALDDDILNPGHTIVKRPEPGRRNTAAKKKLANQQGIASPPKTFDRGAFDASTDAHDVMPAASVAPDVYSTAGGPPYNPAPLSFRQNPLQPDESELNTSHNMHNHMVPFHRYDAGAGRVEGITQNAMGVHTWHNSTALASPPGLGWQSYPNLARHHSHVPAPDNLPFPPPVGLGQHTWRQADF